MRNWISLFESIEPTLVFDPREDAWTFNGFGVNAVLLGEPNTGLGVTEISSNESGNGNAEKALRWIKIQTPNLRVYDPGEPDADSFSFWKRMCEKGIVNSMEDEDNNVIYRDGEWADGWCDDA